MDMNKRGNRGEGEKECWAFVKLIELSKSLISQSVKRVTNN